MARSGNFETKIAGGSTGGYYVGVDWKINNQTSNPPKSNVTASVYVRSSGTGYTISSSAQKNVSVTINGTSYSGTNTIGIGTNVKKVLLTKTVDVPHNSNGTKSCSFSGSFYVGFTLSGTSLKTVSTSGTGHFDNISVNTPPSLGGNAWTNISGTIPENTGNITVSWNAATDAQNNVNGYRVYRYVNGGHNHTLWPKGNSLTDNIGGYGEGTSVYYKVWAYDTFDAYSGEINSNTVVKNSLTGGYFTGHSANLNFNSSSVELYFTGGRNSNGATVRYECYSDDVTVHNRTGTTGDRQTISIWRSGSYPSGPYIKFDDLKNKFKNSNYHGNLHVGLKTYNDYGTSKWAGGSIGVDLRIGLTVASGNTHIHDSSYYTIGGIKYAIPGRKNITLGWPAASDPLGTPITYRIEQNINGNGWTTLYNNVTGTSHAFSLNISGKPTYAFRVVARNGYGWEKELSGSPSTTMYTYSAPSVSITGITRTADKLSVNIATGVSADIPGNAIKALRWTFGSKGGTLATSAKSFDITGLAQTDSGTFSVIIEDNHGSSVGQGAVTINDSVPQFFPVLSVRKNGIGVNCVPSGATKLEVNGGIKADSLEIKDRFFTVGGEANKYYLTVFTTELGNLAEVFVYRRYADPAPASWNNATHPGSLQFNFKFVNAEWGGSVAEVDITHFAQQYSKQVARIRYIGAGNYSVGVWLRGGGAQYRYRSNGLSTPQVHYTNPTINGVAVVAVLSAPDAPLNYTGQESRYKYITANFCVDSHQLKMGSGLWGSSDAGLTANAPSTCLGANNNIYLKSNNYYDNSSDKHYVNGTAGQLRISGSNYPIFRWSSSGTAGNVVNWTNSADVVLNYQPQLDGLTVGTTKALRYTDMGTCDIKRGTGDGVTWDIHNMIIKSHWGIGFRDYRNLCTALMDTREGNMHFKGYVSIRDGQRVMSHIKDGDYWKMTANGNGGVWLKTTDNGLIPASSNNSSGVSSLGNEHWPFNTIATRNLKSPVNNNLDILTNGNTLFIGVYATSGANAVMNRAWSGTEGSEFSFYNNKGNAYGFLGNSNNTWFRVYGHGGSVSYRKNKYNITKADTNEQYENVKSLNIYKYRSKSNEQDKDGNVVKETKREDLYLGCMVDELPIEAVFYDNEAGDGKAVDNYSYATMILGALQEAIKKIEILEKKVEGLENGVRS